jgi:hypothetical protein
MALSNVCLAFYPLWPLLIRTLFHPQTIEQAAYSFLVLSTVILFISTPLLLNVFRKSFNHQYLAFLLVLAFSLNPMGFFALLVIQKVFFLPSLLFLSGYAYIKQT